MNVLSVFDGISSGRLALERAGILVNQYFASEIDKYALQISKRNWADIIQLGDITKIDAESLPKIDLFLCGFPCQSHSSSGKHGGFNDPRGQLFFDALRILNKLKEKNPDIKFLFENVKMKRESADLISNSLGVKEILIDSSKLSAQSRQRFYWTNIPNVCQPEDKKIKLEDILENGYTDREKSYCVDANYAKGGNLTQYFNKGRRQLVFLREADWSGPYRKLSVGECEALQNLPLGYTQGISNTQRYKCIGNGWTVDIISHILSGLKLVD